MIRIEKGEAPPELKEVNAVLSKDNKDIYDLHGAATKVSAAKKKGAKAAGNTIYITAAYRTAEVKCALVRTHYGKCAYCETRILSISHGDVEHFRPKSKYTGTDTGLGYFWLAYDWRNLFLACDMCNETYKGTYFELMPAVEGLIEPSVRLEPGEDVVDDSEESAVLIDPSSENPRAYIEFNHLTGDIGPRGGASNLPVTAARVGKMIRALGLDRADLVAMRHRHIAFLRSMFIIACQSLPGSIKLQEILKGIVDRIERLKGDEKTDGKASQKSLTDFCEEICGSSPQENIWRKPDPGANGEEAMRWLAFSVSPVAEYSALSQDCLLAWTAVLKGETIRASGPTMPTPTSPVYGTTASVPVWPPLPLAPVGAHIALLKSTLTRYIENKTKRNKDMLEATRQMYYNQLNELVADINAFHTEDFDADKAEGLYMIWAVDLEVLNDELELIEATARAAEREKLLEFLDQKMLAAGQAGLPDSDRALLELCSKFDGWINTVDPLEKAWRGTGNMLVLGNELADALCSALDVAMKTPDSSPLVNARSSVTVLDQLLALAPDLIPLSPMFEKGITALLAKYDDWLGRTSTLGQRDNAWKAFFGTHQAKGGELEFMVNTSGPDLKRILAFFQESRKLRQSADALAGKYSHAGIQRGSWRMVTLDSISNALYDMQDARIAGAQVLVNRSAPLVPPAPTKEDPSRQADSSVPHQYRPEKAIPWAVTTAAKQLKDFLAARAKLKVKRKLTAKQQAQLDGLEAADKQINALILKLEAEAAAQQSIVASFGDGASEHFVTTL